MMNVAVFAGASSEDLQSREFLSHDVSKSPLGDTGKMEINN